ncbi:MAG: energy transducer TonB [Candidatus Tectomicrobia bacterium]|nr:energy transducer TonB [Candidatus Tectomicrobia bacterium]
MSERIDRILITGMFLSLILHALAIMWLPGLDLRSFKTPEYTEVELLKEPLPSSGLKKEELPKPPPPPQREEKPQEKVEEVTKPSGEFDLSALRSRVGEVSLGNSPIEPNLSITLPSQAISERISELIKEKDEIVVQPNVEQPGKGLLPSGMRQGKEMLKGLALLEKGEKESADAALKFDTKKIELKGESAVVSVKGIGTDLPSYGITGPASGRQVISRPPPLELDLKVEAEIELKFWVLPDGTVGRVIPLKKGDAQLEAEAIRYLKKWRFNPVAARSGDEESWGVIPFKFLLR